MKPKIYPLLEMAVEEGVNYGLDRAMLLPLDHPTRDQVVVAVTECVLNSICEWFDLDEDKAE